MSRPLFAAALLFGAASWAQTLSVVSAGKLADPWASQLEARVCAQADCVPAAQVVTKKKVDWKKAAKANVDFVVLVEAAKQKTSTVLTIEVHKGARNVLANKVLMINSQTISAKNLDAITTTLWRTTGITPRPLPDDAKKDEPGKDEPVVAKDEPKKEDPKKVEPVTPVAASGDGPAPAGTVVATGPTEPAAGTTPFLTLDVGVEMDNRTFEYAGFRSRELRGYQIPFFPSVVLAVELAPFGGMTGFLKTLSLEASGALAPWLSTATSATETVSTFRGRVDAGALARFPVAGPFSLLARVGFHAQAFTLATPVVGLPNAVYLGARAGLGAEVLFLERFTAFAHANALPMFSSRDLVSSAYFASGANVGLEVRGGLVVRIAGPLSVRANVEWTRYFFVLDSTVVQDRFAQGAVDQYLGFQLAARASF